MAEISIRSLIKSILNEVWKNPALDKSKVSEYIIKLSSLLLNIGDAIVECEKKYIEKKIDIMREEEEKSDKKISMTRVDLLSQNTEEYHNLNRIKELQKVVIENINALKYRYRALEDEYDNIRNI